VSSCVVTIDGCDIELPVFRGDDQGRFSRTAELIEAVLGASAKLDAKPAD
jgi:hypothetical protein